MIVAAEIVDNAGDMGALVDMLDEVKDTLGAVAEETVADGGYWVKRWRRLRSATTACS